MIESWDEFGMDTDVLRGVYSVGFEKPSPIQMKSVKPLMDGKDLLAQAQSGTGKTGAFSIGLLNRINVADMVTQAIVLSPTRELSQQTFEVIKSIGCYMKGLRVKMLVGGSPVYEDIDNLKTNVPHIIVGCPGRTFDMMKRVI